MVKLPYNYYLQADKHQIILCTKREKGERYDTRGYYTTLIGALHGWRKMVTRDIINTDNIQSMNEIITELRKLNEQAEEIIARIEVN